MTYNGEYNKFELNVFFHFNFNFVCIYILFSHSLGIKLKPIRMKSQLGCWMYQRKPNKDERTKNVFYWIYFPFFFQILNWNLYFPIISINFFPSFLLPRSAALSTVDSAHFVEMKKICMLKGIQILLVCECWWTRLHIGHRSYSGMLIQPAPLFMTMLYPFSSTAKMGSASKWPPNWTEWEGI